MPNAAPTPRSTLTPFVDNSRTPRTLAGLLLALALGGISCDGIASSPLLPDDDPLSQAPGGSDAADASAPGGAGPDGVAADGGVAPGAAADAGAADGGADAADAGADAGVMLRDDAEIVSFTFPAQLSCGHSAQGTVVVKNTGTTTWTAQEGYKLGAVGDSDPLLPAARVVLPPGVSVLPNATWQFDLALSAPATAGAEVSDWQMLRENVAWFGPTRLASVSVTCPVVVPTTPYLYPLVQTVAAQNPTLLTINTYESTGQFVQRVLAAMNDPDWGHVAKTAGESQYTPPGFVPRMVDGHLITGFSNDAIFHRPSNQQVDLVANSAANSDPRPEIWGPGSTCWNEIPRQYYRPNNPWIAAVPP